MHARMEAYHVCDMLDSCLRNVAAGARARNLASYPVPISHPSGSRNGNRDWVRGYKKLGSHRRDKYYSSPKPIKLQLLYNFTPDAVAHGHLNVMRMSTVNMAEVPQKCHQMQ